MRFLKSPFLLVVVVAVGCGDVSSKESGTGRQPPIQRGTDSAIPQIAIVPVTETQAAEFAQALTQAVKEQDLERADKLISMRSVACKSFLGAEMPPEIEKIFIEAASKASAMKGPMERVGQGGSYQLLRIVRREDSHHPVFRLVVDSGGVNYHEIQLTLDPQGSPMGIDVHMSQTGEWMSEGLLRLMRGGLDAQSNRGAKLSMAGQETVESAPKLRQILDAIATRSGYREALDAFRTLPESVMKEKAYHLGAIAVAQRISDQEYEFELKRFRDFHPDDPAADIMSIDVFLMSGRTKEALEALDRVDHQIGGDPYLHAIRARAHMAAGDLSDAKTEIQQAMEPTLGIECVYQIALDIALKQNDFDAVDKSLRYLVEFFGNELDLETIQTDADYEAFRATDQYRQLREWYIMRRITDE